MRYAPIHIIFRGTPGQERNQMKKRGYSVVEPILFFNKQFVSLTRISGNTRKFDIGKARNGMIIDRNRMKKTSLP
jgi:hypothetical protein